MCSFCLTRAYAVWALRGSNPRPPACKSRRNDQTSPDLRIFVTVTNLTTPEHERFLDGFLEAARALLSRSVTRALRPSGYEVAERVDHSRPRRPKRR